MGELDLYKRFGTSRNTCSYSSENFLLLVIHTEYLFAWIGQIKVLKLILIEKLIHAILFLCRLVREITGEIRSPGENLHYRASAIAALQHASEHFLADLFEHSNILAIHAKHVTILPSDLHTLKRVARRFNLDKRWI